MSNGKPQITTIETIGIIISSFAALATIGLGFITYHQGKNIENLRSDFEREKLFSENLSGAINYLSSGDRTSRRMAVVSLTNLAETEEQIKEAGLFHSKKGQNMLESKL